LAQPARHREEAGKLYPPAIQSSASVHSLKTERTARKTYRTRDDAKADVFDYIECFYNPKRRHSTIGYLSPVEFEMKAGLA
jgi:transposase InsO family protein